jgi:outer membrane receptor protein involved in Fe transport
MRARFRTGYRRGRNFLNLTQQEEVMATQMKNKPVLRPLALAIMVAISAQAFAQEKKAADENTPLNLDTIVVTGQAQGISKMKSSVSVSTLSDEQIQRSVSTNAAEILRAVPGVRSESSGGEGNANVSVRGVPLSAGGARYVQFQEDGLPILLFGDMAFGTADQFLRADYNVDRLEVIRGGSTSTLASNSPGGILNFISKSGNLGFTVGLDHRQTRFDFDYGAKDNEKTYTHLGGFFRVGEGGPRDAGMNVENGGQFKASITREFDEGYVRINFKGLNDSSPSLMPVPVTVTNGTINTIAGVDPRNAFFITPNLARDTTFNRDGGFTVSNPRDGLSVKSTAIGLESQFNLGNGLTLDEKFRWSENSGRFIALFPANNGDAGPGVGPTFTGTLFNTSLDDFGNKFNDVRLSKKFDMGGDSKVAVTGGLFNGVQNVAETWYWNQYTVGLTGHNASATQVTPGFQTWGGCCVRSWDVQYTTTAPYVAFGGEFGSLNLDASFRHDSQKANGWTIEDNPTTQTWDPATQKKVNYKVNYNSYSLGGNYGINRDLAVFARASRGVSFAADRLLYGKPVDGSIPIDTNQVTQQELGAKYRVGNFSTFVTLFNAKTRESNYEATTQRFTNNDYSSKGVEVEAGYRIGGFRINGGVTYTKAEITAGNDATTIGKKPRRQADFVYQVLPSYSFGDFEFGAAFVGTTAMYGDDGNTITMPAYVITNAYAKYQITPKFSLGVSANNLFDKLGYTEIEGDGHAARAVDGRAVKASLKYSF